ncbi:glycosyltransferase [uncultured Sphingobacterium sp.]|uniref:glycosyltransferase n=1 Tax=uncultured Sphingobacterium sp. TaxID=182688 RepID=UPI0037482A4F
MKNQPILSIIMPVYNGEKYLETSVRSILDQTHHDFEFIIIDDGSSDKTEDIIKSFQDQRIVLISNNRNEGITRSLNKGLYFSRGQYIGRMDCDDISRRDRFELQLAYLEENPNVSIVGSDYEILYENALDDTILLNRVNISVEHEDLLVEFLYRNVICHPTVTMRKNDLNSKKLYYDRWAYCAEDYKLWIDSILSGLKLGSIPIPLIKYRHHGEQVSTTKRKIQSSSACQIMLGYAIKTFGQLIIDNTMDYLALMLISKNTILEDKDVSKYRKLAEGLISENKKNGCFNKDKFTLFIENKLSFLHCALEESKLNSVKIPSNIKT